MKLYKLFLEALIVKDSKYYISDKEDTPENELQNYTSDGLDDEDKFSDGWGNVQYYVKELTGPFAGTTIAKILVRPHCVISPQSTINNCEHLPIIKKFMATSPYFAFNYAYDILGGPFPEGEATIAQHAGAALEYARQILYGPFPAGEPAISQHTKTALYYAIDVLKQRFPSGEPAIMRDEYLWKLYRQAVWPRRPSRH